MGFMHPQDESANLRKLAAAAVEERKYRFIEAAKPSNKRDEQTAKAISYICMLTTSGVQFNVTFDMYCIDFTFNGTVHAQAANQLLPRAGIVLTESFGKLILKWSE